MSGAVCPKRVAARATATATARPGSALKRAVRFFVSSDSALGAGRPDVSLTEFTYSTLYPIRTRQ
jgi:hypothetical protein